MKTLYLELNMGAAGDMLAAALIELLPPLAQEEFLRKINKLGLQGVLVSREKGQKCAISGSLLHVTVNGAEEESHDNSAQHHEHEHEHEHKHEHENHNHEHDHHHEHSSMATINEYVAGLEVSSKVKNDIMAVYQLIAEAESQVHGRPVSEVHFHELGSKDAIMDIAMVAMLMEILAPDVIMASPVNTGFGTVKCAHGLLPVPAPATALLLTAIPSYSGAIEGELCTPTGAALLKYFVPKFGPRPVMRGQRIGYGLGHKDFPAANCVRAFLGEQEDQSGDLYELSCNIDDMSGEELAFAAEELRTAGALEVYLTPVIMKKGRQGTLLTVISDEEKKELLISLIFKHTSTLGIREKAIKRHVLRRRLVNQKNKLGNVRLKEAAGYGVKKAKYEYEDLARIAREQNLSLAEVKNLF